MAIRVALHHKTCYHYDRSVTLSPHEIKLRPAAHARTPILSYSLKVKPQDHFINWQQDPYGNYIARIVFPQPSDKLEIEVDLVADMTVINPFDFFLQAGYETFPFPYNAQMRFELGSYLQREACGPLLAQWLAQARAELLPGDAPRPTLDFIVDLNRLLREEIDYQLRFEPGVQSSEETLQKRSGSCRDSAALLMHILRELGLAARFVSGYLIQLKADQAALDGPSGPGQDFTDLHAWTEVYLPGAGWVGLDPTSGLLAGEGHIPLACSATPSSAAPVLGFTDKAEVSFSHHMQVSRVLEDPRVTLPYSDEEWARICALGHQVDARLAQDDVRLTQGGEPTFVSIDDMDGAEWNTAADGAHKRERALDLAQRLRAAFTHGALLHHGQGKWYPGESLPRWALNLYWRTDGEAIWQNPDLLAGNQNGDADLRHAVRFAQALCAQLAIDPVHLLPAYEDVVKQAHFEQSLPLGADPLKFNLDSSEERRRLARLLGQGLGHAVGYVLPLRARDDHSGFDSCRWQFRRGHLFLLEGESPLGYRLPLSSLGEPALLPPSEHDPLEQRQLPPLPLRTHHAGQGAPAQSTQQQSTLPQAHGLFHTALCVEVRQGVLYVFLPPFAFIEDWLLLLQEIETVAARLDLRLRIEGYTPPRDPRIRHLSVTPDPGVIEVNVQPASNWEELRHITETLYEEARQARLCAEKFMLDGRHTGSGGGNHITLGALYAADSPWLRRPDVLQSLIRFWQNHPSLSYLFSGAFIGPTSQAPRIDEGRDERLYELEIAFQQMDATCTPGQESSQAWLTDRLLRHLLTDLNGNTHRSEFCIDKLYSPDSASGRLGLLELRAFEMPPHARMSLLQMLLLRALVAQFWREPYKQPLAHWGLALHDRWLLPWFLQQDLYDVLDSLRTAGFDFDQRWFDPFIEFRFPRYGSVAYQGIEIELRQALEPWHVLGEEMNSQGVARYVDSSVERLQVLVRNLHDSRHQIVCNGRALPLQPTGTPGEYVAGVRFRAWSPHSALHPTIAVHHPLVFDVYDSWSKRAIGACTYHVCHPGGRNYATFPVNANEAQARRFGRFWPHGHTPGPGAAPAPERNPLLPCTLDLRRAPAK
ncbi:transglutaminase family protein [Massilia sp. W12]|uniref:transglutaminase family protein n=1 Tax=Massilia sp. W12 TaxID=3126507 RepID=UPI0030CEAFF8